MVHVSSEAQCFDYADPDSLVGTRLTVKVDTGYNRAAYSAADYPPVARWDWDRTTGVYYVGLRCGAAWCEVGQEGFISSPHHATSGPRTRVIKGWYDEQVLARVSTPGPKPSGLQTKGPWATVFPELGLDTLTRNYLIALRSQGPDFAWVDVAQTALPPGLSDYATKLNFDSGSVAAGALNTIALCYGTKNDCIPAQYQKYVACAGDPNPQYWARVTSVSRKVSYRCIVYCDHRSVDIPGTARWRWLANDETTWKRCPDGCCTLQ